MHNYFATSRLGMHQSKRSGFTILELIVSIGLLAILMTTSIQMLRLASRQQRAMERRAAELQTVQAVAELAGNLPWDQITPAVVKQIQIPDRAKPFLPDGKLNIEMADETDPIARRISLELGPSSSTGKPGGITRLTTWVFPDETHPSEQ
jgi:prepilin-type N-terminal cleavage/methylation domain-containing protein